VFTHPSQTLAQPEQVFLRLGKGCENRLAGEGDHELA
jgi:hypothetical protein